MNIVWALEGVRKHVWVLEGLKDNLNKRNNVWVLEELKDSLNHKKEGKKKNSKLKIKIKTNNN